MRVPRQLTTALAAGALALGALSSGAVANAQTDASAAPSTEYDQQMLEVMADTFGTTTEQAAQRIDRERAQSTALTALENRGVTTKGAYFSGDDLVVNVTGGDDAQAARDAGLTPRTAQRDSDDLEALAAQVKSIAGDDIEQVQTYGPDLPSQQVVVTVAPGADADLQQRLSDVDGIKVVTGETGGLAPTVAVVGGRIMDLVPGTNCSLGFPGTISGDHVLLTAGHCVEGGPDVLDGNGTHIGYGEHSRFNTGAPSVDMGLMDIDPEDTGAGYIDTRMGTTVPVTGASAAPIGTSICKAGNTTGWTCGQITHYGLTVNYGDGMGGITPTSGLARSTVCTEGGDSGGAYISGTTAQGMTSGGPSDGHDCGYNQGENATGSYSFYQPVVDAANYYGVSLITS